MRNFYCNNSSLLRQSDPSGTMERHCSSIDDSSEKRTSKIEALVGPLDSADEPAEACDEEDVCAKTRITSSEIMIVCGESTGIAKRSSLATRKVSTGSLLKAGKSRKSNAPSNQSTHTKAISERNTSTKTEVEVQDLHEQLRLCRQELAHTKEERDELQKAFRRLDQEITNGYNLVERKEKEMKIAELITKNRKLSQIIEMELKKQEAFRTENSNLLDKVRQLEDSCELQKRVLESVEMKHATLVESNDQLLLNNTEAHHRIAILEGAVADLETRLADSSLQPGHNLEERILVWESKCADLQQQMEGKKAQLRAEREQTALLEFAREKLTVERAALKAEVTGVHDKMIKMEGEMRLLEAKLEASSTMERGLVNSQQKAESARIWEGVPLQKNRRKVSVNRNGVFPHTGYEEGPEVSQKVLSRGIHTKSTSSRIASLEQRIQKAEESRDHKGRCLEILMQMIPRLLHRLDAIQDKYIAAEESTAILSSAIEQLQGADCMEIAARKPILVLAREGYLLSGPYQPELLMGYTMSRALSEVVPRPPRKQPRFLPFQVRVRTKFSDASSDGDEQLLLAADEDDPNGVVFLNRSKINAFLSSVQCASVRGKGKHLLVRKIAELLSTQRELLFHHSHESTYYKASIAKLEAEVHQYSSKLRQLQAELDSVHAANESTYTGDTARARLLSRLIDAILGERCGDQSTFLTQTDRYLASDRLVIGGKRDPVKLDLSDCGILDDEVESLLLKVTLCGRLVTELDLSGNQLTDSGAATLGAFLETRSESLRVVSLQRNHRISSDGFAALIRGLTKNSSGHRIDIDKLESKIVVSAVDEDFDTAGRPTVLLSIYVPEQALPGRSFERDQQSKVTEMIDHLESKGYGDSTASLARARTTYLQASSSIKKSSVGQVKSKSRVRSSSSRLAQPSQSQRERKFRALELALRRAEVSVGVPASAGKPRGISLAQMKRLLEQPRSSSTASTPSALSHHRLSKLHFAQSHLATIRGLGSRK